MWQQVHFDHRKENQKMAIKLDIIEQRQGVKFESTALNGLRGLAAFHVLVFHSIEFSDKNFTIYGTVRTSGYIIDYFTL